MKPIEEERNDLITIGGEEDTKITAELSAEDIAHLFKLLVRQYSDPYGSIVRELTSNAWDENQKSEEILPVRLGFDTDIVGNEYFFVKDYGSGMSPQFMKDVYMKWGKSTKRNTNSAIGYYGIGSKSPLSVREEYYIISVVSSIKYEYIIYFNDQNVPELDILSKNETSEPSGTVIKILLDGDKYKFIDAIRTQLIFFNEVYYENANIDNDDIEIYDFNTFVINKNYYNNLLPPVVCYKRVNYPINFELLDLKDVDFSRIGLKFEIGELLVTPSRESIEYKNREISIIKDRYKSFLLEVVELYNRGSFVIENINEYENAIHNSNFKLISDLNINIKRVITSLDVNFSEKVKIKSFELKYFNDLGLTTPNLSLLYQFVPSIISYHGDITGGKINTKNLPSSSHLKNIFSTRTEYYIVNPDKIEYDKLINKKIGSAYIVCLNKNIKHKKEVLNYLKQSDFYKENDHIPPIKLYSYIKNYILFLLKSRIKKYTDVKLTVDDLLSIELEKDIARKNRISIKGKLVLYYPNVKNKKSDWKFIFNDLNEFENKYYNKNKHCKFIICPNESSARWFNHLNIFNKNTKILEIEHSWDRRKDVYRKVNHYIKFIYLNKQEFNIALLTRYDNMESLEDFTKTTVFGNVATSFVLKDKMEELNILLSGEMLDLLKLINYEIYEILTFLVIFRNKYNLLESLNVYNKDDETRKQFIEDCIEMAKVNKIFNKEVTYKFKKIKHYFTNDDIKLLSIIDLNKVSSPEGLANLICVLKSIRKRVNKQYYNISKVENENFLKEHEYNLILESSEKVKYLQSIK